MKRALFLLISLLFVLPAGCGKNIRTIRPPEDNWEDVTEIFKNRMPQEKKNILQALQTRDPKGAVNILIMETAIDPSRETYDVMARDLIFHLKKRDQYTGADISDAGFRTYGAVRWRLVKLKMRKGNMELLQDFYFIRKGAEAISVIYTAVYYEFYFRFYPDLEKVLADIRL